MKRQEQRRIGWGERAGFAGIGLFTMLYGYGQILRKQPIYVTWKGQLNTGAFVVVIGAIFLLVSVLPWNYINSRWPVPKPRKKTRRHDEAVY
jgi:hypothetical protein